MDVGKAILWNLASIKQMRLPLMAFLTQPGASNNLLRYARIAYARSSEGVLFYIVSFQFVFVFILVFLFPPPFVFCHLLFSFLLFFFTYLFFSFVLIAFFAAFFRKRACLSNSFSFFSHLVSRTLKLVLYR